MLNNCARPLRVNRGHTRTCLGRNGIMQQTRRTLEKGCLACPKHFRAQVHDRNFSSDNLPPSSFGSEAADDLPEEMLPEGVPTARGNSRGSGSIWATLCEGTSFIQKEVWRMQKHTCTCVEVEALVCYFQDLSCHLGRPARPSRCRPSPAPPALGRSEPTAAAAHRHLPAFLVRHGCDTLKLRTPGCHA